MTEPPEPRRPEEGGGAEDYDAAWDDIGPDDLLDGLEDDALLDTIRDGVRGDLGTDALTELLAWIRDQPDEHDPRGLHLPNLGRAEQGENVLEPPGPRQTSERITPTMLSESIARLQQAAQDTSASGPLQKAKNSLDADVLGKLMQAVERIAEMVGGCVQAAEGAASGVAEIQSAGEHAAGAVEDAIEAVQAAAVAVDQATQHEHTFRTTVGNVAQSLAR